MKCFLLVLLAVIALASSACGADCTFKGKSFNKGETYQPPGECVLMYCNGPDAFSAKGCPLVQTLKPCKYIPMDPSKPYPQCCPNFEC